MFALVLLFGLFHGLIFLPVLLSLIGPQNGENAKQMKGGVRNVEDGISRSYHNNGFSPKITKLVFDTFKASLFKLSQRLRSLSSLFTVFSSSCKLLDS